jgi:hypothetical protein
VGPRDGTTRRRGQSEPGLTTVAVRRLLAQRLTGGRFDSPLDAVRSLTAVQSQDYPAAVWALGQRSEDVTAADVNGLFDAGTILRTHVMRPTWHFVLPDDIGWLLSLTAPRVRSALASYDRRLGIDVAERRRAYAALTRALRGGRDLTRAELREVLLRSGVEASGQRLAHVVIHAELDSIVVSGPHRGRQLTYALFEERVQRTRHLDREQALAELTQRYFTGHGPAQARDFAWWSGLSMADVRLGLELASQSLHNEVIDGIPHWSGADAPSAGDIETDSRTAHLLSSFDEFLVAYRDRSASTDVDGRSGLLPFPYGSLLANAVIVHGRVAGTWKRRRSSAGLTVEVTTLDRLDATARGALAAAAGELGRFLQVPVTLTVARA